MSQIVINDSHNNYVLVVKDLCSFIPPSSFSLPPRTHSGQVFKQSTHKHTYPNTDKVISEKDGKARGLIVLTHALTRAFYEISFKVHDGD